jgi:hypothetical protein
VFVFGLDASLFGGYDEVAAIRPAMRSMIFLDPAELPADAGLVAGHIAPATTMARYPRADHVTVLRVPQVRHVSQWLHSRSVSEISLRHWGPSADAFRVGRLPLADYLWHRKIAPSIDNTITRFLTWPHPSVPKLDFIDERDDDALFAAAVDRLDQFGHVNVTENPNFMAELGGWLGCDLPRTRLNERASVPPRMRPNLRAELTDSTRQLLDHRCRIDARIWKHVAGRVLPRRDVDAALQAGFDGAVDRYEEMLRRPDTRSGVRRTVERAYELGVGLDPRRRRAMRFGSERPAAAGKDTFTR